jgi:hypothetical protein
MIYFQTKNPTLGKFWRAFDWKIFLYFLAIWNVLLTIGIFYDGTFFRFWCHVCTKKNLANPDLKPLRVENYIIPCLF